MNSAKVAAKVASRNSTWITSIDPGSNTVRVYAFTEGLRRRSSIT
jgi:hypothetical protein